MLFRFLLILLLASSPALAQEAASKKADVPFRADAGLITAEYYLATGKYMQALDVLNNVLTRHPQDADAYTYRGYAHHKLGDVKEAAENYARALVLNPAHLGANRYMAEIYLEKGEKARAMEQMQAIRAVCGITDCAELTELQSAINASAGQKKK